MTAPFVSPAAAVKAAHQELADAKDLHAALEQRIIDGDDSVTVGELNARRDLIRLAELRIEGARRVLERADADQRREQYQAVADEARALAAIPRDRLAKLALEAQRALARLYDAAAEREREWRRVRERAQVAYADAKTHDELPVLGDTGLTDAIPGHGFASEVGIRTDEGIRRLRHVFAAALIPAMAAVVLEVKTTGGDWDPQQHADLVIHAHNPLIELPELAPDGWRKTW